MRLFLQSFLAVSAESQILTNENSEMTLFLRVMLIVGALGMAVYVFRKIRRSRIRVGEALYWFFFCVMLLGISVFPEAVFWATNKLGIQSPINFVFLCVIFFLIIKVFTLSLHVSMLEEKQRTIAQEIALRNLKDVPPNSSKKTPEGDGAIKQVHLTQDKK